jgi:beta-glucoside operon transcriptional antiterminator
MRIVKILNNNTILVSENQTLAIITGKGVGFGKSKGDSYTPPNFGQKSDSSPKVECQKFVFDASGNIQKYLDLLREVPQEIFELTSQIIEHARVSLPRRFSDVVFYSLADHLNFAIDRKAAGIDLKNALATEIQVFYPEEFQLGGYAVDLINEVLDVGFGNDEKSFIAMHFVNAELGEDLPQTVQITEMIADIAALITAHYNYRFNNESLSYFRFVTHIKFLAQRLLHDEQVIEEPDDTLFDVVKNGFPEFFEGALAIQEYIENKLGKEVSDQELAYLTVHLKRVIDSSVAGKTNNNQ